MSRKDYLDVQFHFDGQFVNNGRTLEYVGGEDAMSMILREKCGIADIHRHLRLYHNISDREMLHWLMPGKGLFDGLGCLANDDACMAMVKHIPKWIQEMITQMDKWALNVIVCPNITKKLKKSINQSAYCETIFNGKDLYEVKLKEWGIEHGFTVKLG